MGRSKDEKSNPNDAPDPDEVEPIDRIVIDESDIEKQADKELEKSWKTVMNGRVRLLEQEIEKLQRELDALRESLAGLVE